MQKWFTTKKRDLNHTKTVKGIDPFADLVEWNRLGMVVVLGAVAATEIASPSDDDLGLEKRLADENVVKSL